MKRLVIGILCAALALLLTAAVLTGYQDDRRVILMFHGTGIAAKIDVLGAPPGTVILDNEATGLITSVHPGGDGTFATALPPGTYRVFVPNDTRTATIQVPNGDCVEVILDYRVPGVVLQVPA